MPDPDTAEVETLQLTLEANGTHDTVTIPRGFVALLAEDAALASVLVGDTVVFSVAQRVHAVVHQSEGAVTDELLAIEAQTMALFEERFGTTFEEAIENGTQNAE
jgi:hypothetical protein